MKTGKDFFGLFLTDTTAKAAETLLNGGKFRGERRELSDLAGVLTRRSEGTPLALVFEHSNSGRVVNALRLVYLGNTGKTQTPFPLFVLPLPDNTLDSLTAEDLETLMNQTPEQAAAGWFGCMLAGDYVCAKMNPTTKEGAALLKLEKDLHALLSCPLAVYDEQARETTLRELETITTPQEAHALRKALEDRDNEAAKGERTLQTTLLAGEILKSTTEGDLQAMKENAQRYLQACEGMGKADESLFLPPESFGEFKHLMNKKRGTETGLTLKGEARPRLLPFKVVEGITLICGARKHGKTTFLLNLLFNEAKKNLQQGNGKRVLFYSYELTKPQIMQQFFALYAREALKGQTAGHYLKDEICAYYDNEQPTGEEGAQYRALLETLERRFFEAYIKSGALVVIAEPLPAEDLCESVRTFCRLFSCSLVGLDYMQELYSKINEIHRKNRVEELKHIGEDLRKTVNALHVPFLAAAQFNRQVRTPLDIETANIGEAGDLERNAQAVIGLFNLKELKQPERQTDVNAVAGLLYRLGLDACDFMENVPNLATNNSEEKRLKPLSGKLFCRLICARFSEAPASVVLNMDGDSGFIDINNSGNSLETLMNQTQRASLREQINTLPTSGETLNQRTSTPNAKQASSTPNQTANELDNLLNNRKDTPCPFA